MKRLIGQKLTEDDIRYDQTLRPSRFKDFVGQGKIKDNLKIFIQAAKERKEPLEHVLFFGPPGLGKTTLAYILAEEMGSEIKTSSGPVLERPGDLAGLLTNLGEGDVLFIDEIHRLNHVVEEYLYPAMEEYRLDIIIDKGPHARSVKLNLPRFTLVGATTRTGLLTSPLRSRFGVANRLGYYPAGDLQKIVVRSSRILQIDIDEGGAHEIAKRARGTPRIANRLLRRSRDFAQVKADNKITKDVAVQALAMLEIDQIGLDEMDRKIIQSIIQQFDGGPVGISNLAVSTGEEVDTIEEVYEPYLIQLGFMKRTPSGRVATKLAYNHFNFPLDASPPQKKLW
ncbi:MAG: Holliday junction branch migration DNA helicase RuvB [Candidatus Omnitrophota bacterium]|nr:Holliday junction branch migration DNA helicase RuvB [Candidatus Omnitrophota bacterium]